MASRYLVKSTEALWAELETEGENMWHDTYAYAVLSLLAEGQPVKTDLLRATLELELAELGANRFDRAKCRGALQQLKS
jgi:hypothetical protein